VTPAGF